MACWQGNSKAEKLNVCQFKCKSEIGNLVVVLFTQSTRILWCYPDRWRATAGQKEIQLKRKGTTLREEGVWERVGQLERLFSTTICSLIKVEGKSRVQRSFEELFGVVTDDSHKYVHVCFYLEASCLAPDLSQVLWRKPSVCFCSC